MVFRYNILATNFLPERQEHIKRQYQRRITSSNQDVKQLTPTNKRFLQSLGFTVLK